MTICADNVLALIAHCSAGIKECGFSSSIRHAYLCLFDSKKALIIMLLRHSNK